MKQSSTFDDVADHILLHEDGDLLTIHQESPADTDEQPPEYDEMVSQNKDTDIFIHEAVDSGRKYQKCERDDILSGFVSTSPSIQTIISKSAAKSQFVTSHKDTDQKNNEREKIGARNPEEDWI